MTLTSADLGTDRRTIFVESGLGPVAVTYRPSVITPVFEANADAAERPPFVYVRDAVSAWGLLGDDDAEYPRTDDALRDVPLGLLRSVYQAICDDITGDEFVVRDLRRALVTGGNIGRMPWWYPLMRSAKYQGVAAWELARQPRVWTTWGLQAEAAEIGAQNELAERAQRKARPRGRR